MAADKQQPAVQIEPKQGLVQAARQAAAKIAERAPEADRQRRVPVENIQDLHEAGLLTVAIPKSLGGSEADLVTQVAVYELIGGACASTAWVMGNHSVLCTRALGMMGDASHPLIQDVVDNGALISHAAIPGGETKPAPGGFVASGRWPFVSGSHLSTWMFLSTMVPGPPPNQPGGQPSSQSGGEPPQAHNRWLVMPSSQDGLTIDPTWMAMAARGSMTNDVLLDQVFVPEDMAPVGLRPAPHEPWLPNGPAALKVPTKARVWMSGMMLGVAQAALDDTIEFGRSRGMTLGGARRGSMPGNQFAVADAAMLIESGRAFLVQEVRAITAKAIAGQEFVPNDAARMEMAGLVARENAQKAVDRLFAVRGTHGLLESGNFERYYRDVRMGTLHAVSAPDLVREEVGKHLFGIPLNAQPRWG
ncbi:MAG: acyl-CoA dehydrogenase family protein [Chloroflexi bacterium]|nr:acyl-CoA dehydrogenase family protein [Chloroflexota bacterium]MDA1270780.1 acyl-CoA dehydrogenase family protein [Chloroflexota bacterium]